MRIVTLKPPQQVRVFGWMNVRPYMQWLDVPHNEDLMDNIVVQPVVKKRKRTAVVPTSSVSSNDKEGGDVKQAQSAKSKSNDDAQQK